MKKNVCIIGAGTAGMAAAYALREIGCEVSLIEVQQKLGGTAVNAWVETWIPGLNPPYLKEILKRIGIDEKSITNSLLSKRFAREGKGGKNLYLPHEKLSEIYWQDMKSAKVEVLCGYTFLDAYIQDRKVKSIRVQNTIDNKDILEISASYFIDASGDGVLATYDGILNKDYYQGEDPYNRFGEDLLSNADLPNEVLIKQLNEPSLFFQVTESDVENGNIDSTVLPLNRISPNTAFLYNGYDNGNWVNPMTGLNISGWAVLNLSRECAYKMAVEQINNYWEFIRREVARRKRDGKPLYGYSDKVLIQRPNGVYAPMLGIRESRRTVCDYMLRQQDLAKLIRSSDLGRNIACGSHEIDFHVYGSLTFDKVNAFNEEKLCPSGIPYDCLIPVRFDNVLVACRAYGASHIALAARRVNKDMAQLGWAAGNAVKWCLRNLSDTQDVRKVNIIDLQSDRYTGFASDVKYMEKEILQINK
jgi:hypothetical protein